MLRFLGLGGGNANNDDSWGDFRKKMADEKSLQDSSRTLNDPNHEVSGNGSSPPYVSPQGTGKSSGNPGLLNIKKSTIADALNKAKFGELLNDPIGFLGKENTRLRILGIAGAIDVTHGKVGSSDILACTPSAAVTFIRLEPGNGPDGKKELQAVKSSVPNAEKDAASHKAYYLPWGSDKAYSIKLGQEADLFITAQLNGCGIGVCETPDGVTVVHQNLTENAKDANKWFSEYFTAKGEEQYLQRNQEYLSQQREESLNALMRDIEDAGGQVIGSATLSEKDYDTAAKASVFGVRRDGQWHIYVNCKDKESGIFKTTVLYSQKSAQVPPDSDDPSKENPA
jgi:hypothetical protein